MPFHRANLKIKNTLVPQVCQILQNKEGISVGFAVNNARQIGREGRIGFQKLANQFIYIVKMSAFASVIGMQELTRRANELVVTEYRPLEIYTLLIVEYLVLVLIISACVRWLERKMGADERI